MIARDARAKLNLYLRVVGRREDGYHLLDSLVAFCDLADTITVAPAGDLTLTIDGPLAEGLAEDPVADNLVLRAARALAGRAGVTPKAAIRLTKRIPVAAGLGGGSADAAATLLALVELWRLAMAEEELFDLAATLGADVPMCLAGQAAQVSGIGERVGPALALPQRRRGAGQSRHAVADALGLCRLCTLWRRAQDCRTVGGGAVGHHGDRPPARSARQRSDGCGAVAGADDRRCAGRAVDHEGLPCRADERQRRDMLRAL